MCDIQLLSGPYPANQGSGLPVISPGIQKAELLLAAPASLAFHKKKSCFTRPEGGYLATQTGPFSQAVPC